MGCAHTAQFITKKTKNTPYVSIGGMEKMNENETMKLIDDVLTRGVGEFIDPDGAFKKKLLAKAKGEYKSEIIVKFGVDPTRPDIHLGHAVVLHKLRQLQDLGCKVIFLVGDFTAQIGDPTGKSKVRPEVAQKEVERNMATYLDQVDKVLRVERDKDGHIKDGPLFTWMRNSDWFLGVTDMNPEGASEAALVADIGGKKISIPITPNSFVSKAVVYENTRMQKVFLKRPNTHTVALTNVLAMLRNISYAQLIERDLFQERLRSKEPLFLHEMMYPVFQGIDSQVLSLIYGSCDLEIGGTDQTFNMLMGRKVMEVAKTEPQGVLSVQVLVGTDGKEKMSKSLDNYIGITESPKDMFGKIMSLPDSAIGSYFELCTFTPLEEIEAIGKKLKAGKVNPRDIKMDLAEQVVAIYHGKKKGVEAREEFIQTFQAKKLPTDIPVLEAKGGTLLIDALLQSGAVESKSEFRRLLEEGAIRKNGEEKLTDPLAKVEHDMVLKVGKRRFFRIATF